MNWKRRFKQHPAQESRNQNWNLLLCKKRSNLFQKQNPHKKPGETKSLASQSIRVNVDILEDLMTMVSELVLTRNQLMQIVRGPRRF